MVQLTVDIAAQQLQAESRLLHIVERVDPDVASHKWRRKVVVFHPGAVHVATKCLNQRQETVNMINSTTIPQSRTAEFAIAVQFPKFVMNNSKLCVRLS